MQTYKVYLNVYDFMRIGRCLEAIGMGAYHTGIEVGNIQYCYSVCSTDPEDSGILQFEPQMADYIFVRKVYLGEVTIMNYRLTQIINELAEEYTCGKYHMFNYNCNHFSNDLAIKLTNTEIPKYLFRASNFLGVISCCLPADWLNGQVALRKLIEEDEAREKQRKALVEKYPIL